MTQDAEFYFKRSDARYKADDVSGGDADLDHAIELAPDNLEYRLERAILRYEGEEYQLAIEDFSKIVALSMDIEVVERDYHILAISHGYLGLPQELLADLDWLIAHDLANTSDYSWRASIKNQMGHYEESIADLTKALELSPGGLDWLLRRARDYAYLKRYEDEIRDLTAVIDSGAYISQFRSTLYLDRATAFFHLGNREHAYSDFNQAVQLGLTPFTTDAVKYFAEIFS